MDMSEAKSKIQSAKRICVSTGAGISAESGVPTFRGSDGLWKNFRPEELATMDAFLRDSKLVWEWYLWRREKIKEAKPNAGHSALINLAAKVENFTLVTQNVDNLHREAGSAGVLELHGNIMRNQCMNCSHSDYDLIEDIPPHCPACGNERYRPGVVWFGESLPQDVMQKAFDASADCDVFICVGSSNIVYPAASLPQVASEEGAYLIEVNPEPTPLSEIFHASIRGTAAEILPALCE